MSDKSYISNGKIETSAEAILYWAEELKCSQKDLENAVSRIGNSYTILLLYLEMNRLIEEQ